MEERLVSQTQKLRREMREMNDGHKQELSSLEAQHKVVVWGGGGGGGGLWVCLCLCAISLAIPQLEIRSSRVELSSGLCSISLYSCIENLCDSKRQRISSTFDLCISSSGIARETKQTYNANPHPSSLLQKKLFELQQTVELTRERTMKVLSEKDSDLAYLKGELQNLTPLLGTPTTPRHTAFTRALSTSLPSSQHCDGEGVCVCVCVCVCVYVCVCV